MPRQWLEREEMGSLLDRLAIRANIRTVTRFPRPFLSRCEPVRGLSAIYRATGSCYERVMIIGRASGLKLAHGSEGASTGLRQPKGKGPCNCHWSSVIDFRSQSKEKVGAERRMIPLVLGMRINGKGESTPCGLLEFSASLLDCCLFRQTRSSFY